jgi:hypothetical protein
MNMVCEVFDEEGFWVSCDKPFDKSTPDRLAAPHTYSAVWDNQNNGFPAFGVPSWREVIQ